MASFSSANLMISAGLPSSSFTFSRSATVSRPASAISLPNAQRDPVPVLHLHVTGVHAAGKARMALERRALGADRGGVDVFHHLDGVRISHREDGDFHRIAVHAQSFPLWRGRRAHVHA